MAPAMPRGDLYWVDLDPSRGSEANKTRPAVLVSSNATNRAAARTQRGVVTIVPITSNTERVLPFQVLLDAAECGLPRDSKAQAEQVRPVRLARLLGQVGSLSRSTMSELDKALRLHLSL